VITRDLTEHILRRLMADHIPGYGAGRPRTEDHPGVKVQQVCNRSP
jgi:hypothetical protein